MIKFFTFCLQRRFLTLEGPLEKLSPSRSAGLELQVVEGKINCLEDITCKIVDHFSHVLRITNGTKFIPCGSSIMLWKIREDLARRKPNWSLGMLMPKFGQNIE